MRRRDFIALFGGAAVWPLSAFAQNRDHRRLIGVVTGFSPSELQPFVAAFTARLGELGWTGNQAVTIDARATAGDFTRLSEETRALVADSPDVIVAVGTPGLQAVTRHSRDVPVVFVLVADPVAQGFIDNLARPGGNATGLTNFEFSIGSKWIELLKEIDRDISRVALIANPANANTARFVETISAAGQSIGIEATTAAVRNAGEIEQAITSAGGRSGGSLIVFPDSLPVVHRDLIIGLAARYRMPAVYPFRTFPRSGGLMSYGLDIADVFRQAAIYADKILRGAKPAELPVQAPNKFELIINLKTARQLGLTVPLALQVSADEVIE